jgi:hypothetical protein
MTTINTNQEISEEIHEPKNEEYINKITLEYLLNPSIHIKTNNSNEVLNKDIKVYKKRISQITKDMTNGTFINTNLQSIFNNYASQLIYYFKQIDYEEMHQKEYNDTNDTLLKNNDDEQTNQLVISMIKDINIKK